MIADNSNSRLKTVFINKGFVELKASEATDLSVVNAARVSFGKYSEELKQEDEKLIGFLLKNRHGTPFEHNFFQFHIKAPIFVAREWFRHRIGSFNEISMRYTVPEIDFFIPDPSDVRTQVGKPGAYHFEPHTDIEIVLEWIDRVTEHCEASKRLYEWGIENGIAKEQARIIFPVNIYTEFYWSINARSLMNFLSLRNSEHAMKEIRDFAGPLESFLQQEMPVTYEAFVTNNRVAP
jgi:thymidylate synthase (FAD)